jgi:hypothetical protein
MEDEDNRWKSVGDRGDRIVPDPVIDLRPLGVKSKFWALMDDDVSDEKVIQLPLHVGLGTPSCCSWFRKGTACRGRDGFAGLIDSTTSRSICVPSFFGYEGGVSAKHH